MVDFDRALLGRMFKTDRPIRVTAGMIASFCAVMGDSNPLYANPGGLTAAAILAPPGFVAAFRALEDIFDYLPNNVPRLAAGMDIEFAAVIRAGDAITIASQLAETYSKTGRSGPMTFFVIRSTLTNQHEQVVARIDHRFSYKG